MVPPPPNDTPPPTPSSPTMKLEVDVSPIRATCPNISPHVFDALMTSVANMNRLEEEDSHGFAVPSTPVSATSSSADCIKNEAPPKIKTTKVDDAVPKHESDAEVSVARAKHTSDPIIALHPSTELTIDKFDELIFSLSYAILQLVQHIETGDATQLNAAVTEAQKEIRDHYIAVSEMKKDAVLDKSEHEATKEHHSVMRPRQVVGMERHKAEADRLRLSLHQQSDTLAEVIGQRDEAIKTKTALMSELADEKRQRGGENAELGACKGEIDRLNALLLQATAANEAAAQKVEAALKDAETANLRRTAAIQVVDKVTRERDVANLGRDAARLDRDALREERNMAVRDRGILLRRLDELETQQMAVEEQQAVVEKQQVADEQAEKAKARREAFEALTSKLNEKKRKGPSGEGFSGFPPGC